MGAMLPKHHDIVFTGQGKWGSVVARGLREFGDLEVGLAPFDRAREAVKLSRWSALLNAKLVVRIGFRPGARTWRGRGVDAALRIVRWLHRGQRTAYYWIGTDLLHMAEDIRSGRAPLSIIRELRDSDHIAVARPIVEELHNIGIDAQAMTFYFENMPRDEVVDPLPERFTVLTYIPDARAPFYGSAAILEAARRLPDVRFRIMGGAGETEEDAPHNVEYLGWQTDAAPLFRDASVVVRMVEHDGAGGTVLEALSYGRQAIYSRQQDDVIYVPFGDADELTAVLRGLNEMHIAGELKPNETLALDIRRRYAPQNVYPRFAQWLRIVAEKADS